MEMKLATVINILEQGINPKFPTFDDTERVPGEFEAGIQAGIQNCIDLLTKISKNDNLILPISFEHQTAFQYKKEEIGEEIKKEQRLKELADDLGSQEYLNDPLVA